MNKSNQMPTIDAVPVVRYKDCESYKKSGEYEDENGEIKNIGIANFIAYLKILYKCSQDDFCSYGERRNEEI